MSAHLVLTREKTVDRSELEMYWEQIRATFAGHQVRFLASCGAHEGLEGPPAEGTAIAELPSMAAAKAWYDSPAYRAVREHRFKGAFYRGLLVDGIGTAP
jgi:uncharacterized protein (DUF1330 family)